MTMKRSEKAKAQQVMTGRATQEHMSPTGRAQCRADGRGHFNMTPAEYAERWLGRRQTPNAETAAAKKMEKAGWVATDRGGFRRVVRRILR